MAHLIEFVTDWWVDLERPAGQPVQRELLRKGTKCKATVRPRILERDSGPIEGADLTFEDGSTVRAVPFAAFAFAD